MSPASYRTAPPRVGNYYCSPPLRQLQTDSGDLGHGEASDSAREVGIGRNGKGKGRAKQGLDSRFSRSCAHRKPGWPRWTRKQAAGSCPGLAIARNGPAPRRCRCGAGLHLSGRGSGKQAPSLCRLTVRRLQEAALPLRRRTSGRRRCRSRSPTS